MSGTNTLKQRLYQAIVYLILMNQVVSCSDAKIATRSYDRFKKHGGKIDCYDVPLLHATDSIFNATGDFKGLRKHLYPCICPDVEFPTPRYVYRFDYKKFKDSLRMHRRILSDSMSAEIKHARLQFGHDEKMYRFASESLKNYLRENRKLQVKLKKAEENWKLWFVIGASSMFALMILIRLLIKKVKSFIPLKSLRIS